MKPEELMIGDWVFLNSPFDKETHLTKITYEDLYYLQSEYNQKNLFSPIPITVEILEKNGFAHTNFRVSNRHGCLLENDKFQCYLSWHYNDLDIELSIMNRAYEFFENAIGIKIKYVHELQHALKLSGVDLKIEL